MTESATSQPLKKVEKPAHSQSESIISAISVGFVFILFGAIYVIALPTNLFQKTIDFFGNLTSRQLPGTDIFLPAPTIPGAHTAVYTAAFQFCLGLIFLQVVVLLLRLVWNSPTAKTAETIGNLVFWTGSAWLATTFLNNHTTVNTWFVFWAGVLVMIGISLIARGAILLLRK